MKPKEAVKSLIIALLITSMLVMSVRIMVLESAGDGADAPQSPAAAIMSGLGLDFLGGLFAERGEVSLTDFDASTLIFPDYIALSNDGLGKMTADTAATSAVYAKLHSFIAGALTLPCTPYSGNLARLCHENGMLVAFSNYISADLFVRLFTESGAAYIPTMQFNFVFINRLGLYFSADNKTYFCELENSLWSTASQGAYMVVGSYADDIFDGTLGMYPAKSVYFEAVQPVRNVYNSRGGVFDALAVNELVSLFGFSYASPNRNVDQNGTLTYASNTAGISIGTDSRLRYYSTQTDGGLALSGYVESTPDIGFSQKAVCAAARGLLDKMGAYIGTLRLSNVSYNESSGEFIISFDLTHNGYPVLLEDGLPAAIFTYRNGYFTGISVSLTTLASAGDYDMGLPSNYFELLNGKSIEFFEITYAEKDGVFYPEYRYKN